MQSVPSPYYPAVPLCVTRHPLSQLSNCTLHSKQIKVLAIISSFGILDLLAYCQYNILLTYLTYAHNQLSSRCCSGNIDVYYIVFNPNTADK